MNSANGNIGISLENKSDTSIKVHPIKIKNLISTINSTAKTFRISFTGGEPTLIPNFVEACRAITQKHYISFNSNLISKNIKRFIEEIEPERVLHIHASFHYDELIEMDKYSDEVELAYTDDSHKLIKLFKLK